MEYVLLLMGVFIGALMTSIMRDIRAGSGTLRVDHSNPEKDVYRLEVDDLDKLDKKKRLNLKIDHHANLSQK